jgi:hypothetical protein
MGVSSAEYAVRANTKPTSKIERILMVKLR